MPFFSDLNFPVLEMDVTVKLGTKGLTYPQGLLSTFALMLAILLQFSSVQFSSIVQSYLTLCDPMNRSMPGLPVHHHLLGFTQTHVHRSVMPSSHLILGHPLLLLPPIPPSIGVFSNESTLRMRWPKYWSFTFSIIPSKEIPVLKRLFSPSSLSAIRVVSSDI